MTNPDLKLSPKYSLSDWCKLNLDKNDSPDWITAADVFHDRINGRFLAPIEAIEKHVDKSVKQFCGFTVLAIDCLIIETLYQFYNGLNETDSPHSQAFWKFFQASPHFSPHFTEPLAIKFYTHFRCGILHQAQTKERSRVKIKRSQMVEAVDPNNLSKGLIIDREKFHRALVQEIEDYVERLRNPQTQIDHELREHFKQKMCFITTT